MSANAARNLRLLPDRIPIHDPHLLASLWEQQELQERLVQLEIIAEHIDLHNADLTIVAWEKFLSIIDDLDHRCALNLECARNNALHLDIELRDDEGGIDALWVALASIDLTDTVRFSGAKIHPGRHLVCNIGVLRAGTAMKAACSLIRSTHTIEPTAGVVELVSQLDSYRQTLASEIDGYQDRMLMELSEQGYDVCTLEFIPDLCDFKRSGMAYWMISWLP